jgi:hypothetical protein
MAYRDVSESLRAYRDRVASDLDEARRAAKDLAEQASKATVLEKELAETDALLAKMAGRGKGLPMLDDVHIAAPCKASWEQMVGDEHVRFCGQCEKNVYNLSSLPREEAEALLAAKEGNMCVRLYRRADGTVLTSDCPVGVKKRRRRRAALAVVGGGLMAAVAAIGMEESDAHRASASPEPTGQTGQWSGGVVAVPTGVPVMGGSGAVPPPPVPQQHEVMGKPVMGRR